VWSPSRLCFDNQLEGTTYTRGRKDQLVFLSNRNTETHENHPHSSFSKPSLALWKGTVKQACGLYTCRSRDRLGVPASAPVEWIVYPPSVPRKHNPSKWEEPAKLLSKLHILVSAFHTPPSLLHSYIPIESVRWVIHHTSLCARPEGL
jgi:hypothetical protein